MLVCVLVVVDEGKRPEATVEAVPSAKSRNTCALLSCEPGKNDVIASSSLLSKCSLTSEDLPFTVPVAAVAPRSLCPYASGASEGEEEMSECRLFLDSGVALGLKNAVMGCIQMRRGSGEEEVGEEKEEEMKERIKSALQSSQTMKASASIGPSFTVPCKTQKTVEAKGSSREGKLGKRDKMYTDNELVLCGMGVESVFLSPGPKMEREHRPLIWLIEN